MKHPEFRKLSDPSGSQAQNKGETTPTTKSHTPSRQEYTPSSASTVSKRQKLEMQDPTTGKHTLTIAPS